MTYSYQGTMYILQLTASNLPSASIIDWWTPHTHTHQNYTLSIHTALLFCARKLRLIPSASSFYVFIFYFLNGLTTMPRPNQHSYRLARIGPIHLCDHKFYDCAATCRSLSLAQKSFLMEFLSLLCWLINRGIVDYLGMTRSKERCICCSCLLETFLLHPS